MRIYFAAKNRQTLYLREVTSIPGYNNLKIGSIKVDCSKKIFSIRAKASTNWVVIPNSITLQKVSALLTMKTTSPQTTLEVNMKGYWGVGNLNVTTKITYKRNTGITSIIAQPRPGTSLTRFVRYITGLSLPVDSSVKVDFELKGEKYPDGSAILLLKSEKYKNKFYALIKVPKKNSHRVQTKAIALKVSQVRLSALLHRLIKRDYSNTPFFGRVKMPEIGMIYSTGNMKISGIDMFTKSPLLQTTGKNISTGLTAFIKVSFHEDPLIAKYHRRVLVLTTPRRNLRLDKLLQHLLSGGGSWQLSLPLDRKKMLSLYIEIIKVKETSVTAVVSFPRPVVFFEGFLKVSKVKAETLVQKKKPRVSVTLTGNIHLAGSRFQAKLARNRQKKYVLTAIGDKLNINSLLQHFRATILPASITDLLPQLPFLKMVVLKPRISYIFGVRPLQMHVGGIPRIHGYKIVDMDILLLKVNGKLKATLAFQMGSTNIADLMTKITGTNFRHFAILNRQVKMAVIISPITTRQAHLAGKLSSLPISKGISVRATTSFPKNCRSDKFCNLVGKLIGRNTPLVLKATIRSTNYYSITAAIHRNLRLGRGLTLSKVGLEIVAGSSSRIGLKGELKLSNPHLIFGARISVGNSGLTLQFSMTNCWHRAFGAEWLDICNLLGAVSFVPPAVKGFQLGAQIHLGYRHTHRLKAKVYVGINLINPSDRYFYAKFNRVNMMSLLRAFNIKWFIPRPLGDSGFPRGFVASYSLLGKELPSVHLSIPRGYRIKGKLHILGLQGHADITIALPTLLDVKVALPPIRIRHNILAMYASPRDKTRGPYLRALVRLRNRHVHIEASGYLHVLGILFHTKLKITNTHYHFSFRHKLFNLFRASVHMSARYGNVYQAHFHLRGHFESDIFGRIQNIAKGLLNHAAHHARNVLNPVLGTLHRFQHLERLANGAFNRIRNSVHGLKHRANRLHHHMNRLGHTVNRLLHRVNRLRNIANRLANKARRLWRKGFHWAKLAKYNHIKSNKVASISKFK